MRRRLTYANVAATMALVFSMSGGAIAANHYLVNSAKQIKPSVLKKLKGATGKTGAAGAPGLTGKEGPAGKEGAAGKAATIPPLTFSPLALEHGWINYNTVYGVPGYAKDAEGFVHLTGAVDGASETSAVIATLPLGFRPKAQYIWVRAAATNGGGDPHLVD